VSKNVEDTRTQTIDSPLLVAEYSALRDEILKRIEFQHQLVSLTLIVAGTFLTIGVQANVPSSALLVYPILALFLAAGWAQDDVRINQLSVYIREKIEKHLGGFGWENYRQAERVYSRWGPFGSLGALSARGVFLVTQFLTIALALTRFAPSPQEIVLLVVDGIAILFTFILLRRWRREGRK